MLLVEKLKLVFHNIVQNKGKVFLTSIGIIAGTATIVAVIAIGKGGEADIKAQFSGLSAETIYVKLDNGFGQDIVDGSYERLNEVHMNQVLAESTTLKGAYLRARAYQKTVINGKESNTPILGVSEQYAMVSNLQLYAGVNLDGLDVELQTNVVLLGYEVAQSHFLEASEAIGQTIQINGVPFQVIGVLERSADGLQGMSPDDTLFIPFSTYTTYYGEEGMPAEMVALATDITQVKRAMAEIKDTLDYVLERNVYRLEDTGSRMKAASQSSHIMNLLLISISFIVFLVGGIGIMNVLSLSVKERTKEIGVLKALGCKERTIMQLFLLEAMAISGFGGIVGVLLSQVLLVMVQAIAVPILPTPQGLVMGLLFALITGTLFGIAPAYQASKLEPVAALNYE